MEPFQKPTRPDKKYKVGRKRAPAKKERKWLGRNHDGVILEEFEFEGNYEDKSDNNSVLQASKFEPDTHQTQEDLQQFGLLRCVRGHFYSNLHSSCIFCKDEDVSPQLKKPEPTTTNNNGFITWPNVEEINDPDGSINWDAIPKIVLKKLKDAEAEFTKILVDQKNIWAFNNAVPDPEDNKVELKKTNYLNNNKGKTTVANTKKNPPGRDGKRKNSQNHKKDYKPSHHVGPSSSGQHGTPGAATKESQPTRRRTKGKKSICMVFDEANSILSFRRKQ